MGIFGIKTKKERAAEKAEKARKDARLIDDIMNCWSERDVRDEYEAVKNGLRDYSYEVERALEKRRRGDLMEAIERGEREEARRLSKKIEEAKKDLDIANRMSPWEGGDGVYKNTPKSRARVAAAQGAAQRRIEELERQRDNIGRQPY